MTPLTELAAEYAAEIASAPYSNDTLRALLTRAYMAGALEAARHKPHDVIRECLDFARTIGTPAERAQT